MSKNLPFPAIAAFGLIVTVIAQMTSPASRPTKSRPWRLLAGAVVILLLVVHIPVAAMNRAMLPKLATASFRWVVGLADIGYDDDLAGRDVVIVNAPSPFSLLGTPFFYAYEDKPIPRSLRTLFPSWRDAELTRVDERTLRVCANDRSLLSPVQHSPIHIVYIYEKLSIFRADRFGFTQGERIDLPGLNVEIDAVDEAGKPHSVTFTFDSPLEQADRLWLWFDWPTFSYREFTLPAPGQTLTLAGPPKLRIRDIVRIHWQAVREAGSR
jgi:hypothetical protein